MRVALFDAAGPGEIDTAPGLVDLVHAPFRQVIRQIGLQVSFLFGLISPFIGRSCSKHPDRIVNFAKRGGTRPYRVIVDNLGGSLDSSLGLPALESA